MVLAFIGVKMLLDPHDNPPKWFQVDISTSVSLIVVATIILISILFSIASAKGERKAEEKPADEDEKVDKNKKPEDQSSI
jgi:predicted tellurium resistance membrane protein TerC